MEGIPPPLPKSSWTSNWGEPVTSSATLWLSCQNFSMRSLRGFLPRDHPGRKRAAPFYRSNPSSASYHTFDSINVHLAFQHISFTMLSNHQSTLVLLFLDWEMVHTSIAANVTTASRVASWKAKMGSSIFRRMSDTASPIKMVDIWKPFWACSSASNEAVCSETLNNAGSARASGHQQLMKGFEVGLVSRG